MGASTDFAQVFTDIHADDAEWDLKRGVRLIRRGSTATRTHSNPQTRVYCPYRGTLSEIEHTGQTRHDQGGSLE